MLKIIEYKMTELMAWSLFVLVAFNKFNLFSIVDHEIVTLATIIIINQVSNPQRLISLENKLFDYFGKISYGLYIYNPLVIYLLSFLLKDFLTRNTVINMIIIYGLSIFSVGIISHLSYFYFESIFLKFKVKFAAVKSKSSIS